MVAKNGSLFTQVTKNLMENAKFKEIVKKRNELYEAYDRAEEKKDKEAMMERINYLLNVITDHFRGRN